MNHQQALETLVTEKYLLDELDPEQREEFEEHYFSCKECASEVKAGLMFLEQSKKVFREQEQRGFEVDTATRTPAKITPAKRRDWFGWLRPAFAVPAMALMLGVLFFQNAVQFPAMQSSLNRFESPAVMASAYLPSGNARGALPVVTADDGQPFVLVVDLPGDSGAAYTAELYDAGGRKQWPKPLNIPAGATKDNLSLRVPGGLKAGNYSLAIQNAAAPDGSVVSRSSFTLIVR